MIHDSQQEKANVEYFVVAILFVRDPAKSIECIHHGSVLSTSSICVEIKLIADQSMLQDQVIQTRSGDVYVCFSSRKVYCFR